MTTQPRKSDAGFTIVELLVVIAITSVLLALFLPSLNAAREAGRSGACVSNLRQIGIGYAYYVNANKEWWPDGSGFSYDTNTWPDEPTWARVIAKGMDIPYITEQSTANAFAPEQYLGNALSRQSRTKNNGIFQCPTDNFTNAFGGKNSTTYSHNSGGTSIAANSTRGGLGIGDAYFFHPQANRRWTWAPVRSKDLTKQSETFVVGESIRVTVPATAYEYHNTQFGSVLEAGSWHNGSGNYLWVDGHASSLKPENFLVEFFYRGRQ